MSCIRGRPKVAGQLYVVNTDSPETRPLGLLHSGLLAVSSTGELAIITWGTSGFPMNHSDLARVPLNGGSPRVIGHGVYGADFAPDGETLATLKDGGRRSNMAAKRSIGLRGSSLACAFRHRAIALPSSNIPCVTMTRVWCASSI